MILLCVKVKIFDFEVKWLGGLDMDKLFFVDDLVR